MILVSDAVSNRLFLADDDYVCQSCELVRGKLSKRVEKEIELICWGFKFNDQQSEKEMINDKD